MLIDTNSPDWYNNYMSEKKNLKKKIIASIDKSFSSRFRVIDNTIGVSKSFNGVFPDVILTQLDPSRKDDILFLMKIEEDENTDPLDSAPIWKIMSEVPAFLYIIVPERKELESKKIIQTMRLRARIATFSIDHNGKVSIKYE